MLGKILSMATVGSAFANRGLLYRCFLSAFTIFILVFVCAFLLCSLLGVVGAMIYISLVRYGVDPFGASLVLGLFILAAILILLAVISAQIKELRQRAYSGDGGIECALPNISNIASAFVDGFINSKKS